METVTILEPGLLLELLEEQPGQGEMAEVIGADLEFEAVLGFDAGA